MVSFGARRVAALLALSTGVVNGNFTNPVTDQDQLPLSSLSRNTSQSSLFEPVDATIDSVHSAIFGHGVTCRAVVQSFLDRIASLDQAGPRINALISVNRHALDYADELDLRSRSVGFAPGSLHCVPILLKDNFDTLDMATTAGSLSLKDWRPAHDAPTVQVMREQGAIILAKANMHEMALTGLTISSITGQTKNPYDLTRTPGGSSGGTGAGVAASFGVLGTGTDTIQSIRSPSSANSLVGIRPSRGLISRAGVIPVSTTQDAVGPIARTVRDAAVLLNVMTSVGFDPADNVTALGAHRRQDYVRHVTEGADMSLAGVRIGIVDVFINRTDSDPEVRAVNQVFNSTINALLRAGASLHPVLDPLLAIDHLFSTYDVQLFEYEEGVDRYFSTTPSNSANRNPRTVQAILSEDLYEKEEPYMAAFLRNATLPSYNSSSPAYHTRRVGIDDLRTHLATRFAEQELDVLLYPHQSRLVVPIGSAAQTGRNGLLASLAGFPAICLPGGFSPPSETAPIGIPAGVEFMGKPFEEGRLLQIASAFERIVNARKPPQLGVARPPSDT